METPEKYDEFERAEPEAEPKKVREESKADPDEDEAKAIGLTREELLEVRATQRRLWPLGQ